MATSVVITSSPLLTVHVAELLSGPVSRVKAVVTLAGLPPPTVIRALVLESFVETVPVPPAFSTKVPVRLGIGYLPQESSVFRKLTVEENLLAILETLDMSAVERRARARELLAELDLVSLAPYPAYTLSGGERRRLEITRALVTSPRYLLLDEPFTGIDPIAIGDIQEIVARLKERGIGILITDHNVRETLAITDRAYILYDGRILVSGTATEIAANPRAREIYLGERFSL